MSWETKRLNEVANVFSGYAFKSSDMDKQEGIPLLKIKNIHDKKVDKDCETFLNPSAFKKNYQKFFLQKDDFLVAMTGQGSVGRIGKMRSFKEGFLVNQRVGIVRVNKAIADPEFIYQSLATDDTEGMYFNLAMGAGQPNLSPKDIGSANVPFPPLPIQQKIAAILAAYDDLIENNLKRIKLLEEIAQITYEEWFVRLRFPGHESTHINLETGLPEGWQEVGLSDLITKLESGSRPKGGIDKNLNEGVPSVGAENVIGLGRYNYSSEKLVPEEFFSKMKRGKICQKDILIYKDGAYIGKTSMFQDNFPHQICAVNEHVFLINSAEEFFQNYLFFTLSREDYYLKMQGLNSNAAQPGLNQEKLKSLYLIKPLDKNIEDFNSHIEPMVRSIFALAKQNRLLQNARDILLPRLMTGVIDVESYDPAQLIKEAA